MNRKDLMLLAKTRLKDARVLLRGKRYDAAYYLSGYAVECAIKACIAKKTKEHDFPDKDFAHKCYEHNLLALIKTAGLGDELNRKMVEKRFSVNVSVVKDWDVNMRYRTGKLRKVAMGLYSAITNKKFGIFSWLKNHW